MVKKQDWGRAMRGIIIFLLIFMMGGRALLSASHRDVAEFWIFLVLFSLGIAAATITIVSGLFPTPKNSGEQETRADNN